jgi:hypothetical protein
MFWCQVLSSNADMGRDMNEALVILSMIIYVTALLHYYPTIFSHVHMFAERAFVMSVHLSMCIIALPTGQTSVKFYIEGFYENVRRKSRSVEKIQM